MTDAELLQQAKDQVATGNGFKNWDGLKDYCYELTGCGDLCNYHEEAALLAIQSAREEAYRYGFIDGDHEHNEMALEPCLQEYLKRINTAD